MAGTLQGVKDKLGLTSTDDDSLINELLTIANYVYDTSSYSSSSSSTLDDLIEYYVCHLFYQPNNDEVSRQYKRIFNQLFIRVLKENSIKLNF